MSEPSVRFFENPEGERVAYAVHGEGPPLLCTAWWVSHLEEDWENPSYRAFFSRLAERHTVIRYDRPGAGLSDRDRARVDLSSEVSTLRGLVDHLGLERTSILGIACAGPPSISFAAENMDRVDRIALFGSYVAGSDVGKPEVKAALRELVLAHWGLGATALADLFSPSLSTEQREALSKAQRRAATGEMSARLLKLIFDIEVREQARRLKVPALVLHRRGDRAVPVNAGRELAATLPEASLQTLDGDAHVPWFGDYEGVAELLLDFFGAEPAAGEAAPAPAAPEGDALLREGELWRVRFNGTEVILPASRGLSDLAILLARPGEEIHVGVLWSGAESAAELGGGADPILDDEALAVYRARLAELDEALEDAVERGLSDRAEDIREERDSLARELRSAVGLGGRKRGLNDVSERARKAVTARIRASLKKIHALHPELGAHLDSHVKTGTYCAYEPPSGAGWDVR